jgi:hypothetical protein
MAKPTISTCRGCGKVFTSLAAFDAHRVGDWGKPIYEEKNGKPSARLIGYTRHTRRCMTSVELQSAGFCSERRLIPVIREGVTHRVECEVWYDPAAREALREAFTTSTGSRESEPEPGEELAPSALVPTD